MRRVSRSTRLPSIRRGCGTLLLHDSEYSLSSCRLGTGSAPSSRPFWWSPWCWSSPYPLQRGLCCRSYRNHDATQYYSSSAISSTGSRRSTGRASARRGSGYMHCPVPKYRRCSQSYVSYGISDLRQADAVGAVDVAGRAHHLLPEQPVAPCPLLPGRPRTMRMPSAKGSRTALPRRARRRFRSAAGLALQRCAARLRRGNAELGWSAANSGERTRSWTWCRRSRRRGRRRAGRRRCPWRAARQTTRFGRVAMPANARSGHARTVRAGFAATRRPHTRTSGPRVGKSIRVQPGSSYRQARQEAPIRRASSPSAARPIRRCHIDQEFTNRTLSSLNIPKPSPLNPHSRPTATRFRPRGPAGHAARPPGLPTVPARGTCGDHGCAGTSPLPRSMRLGRSERTSTGSRDRTRTYNLPVNSRTLCRLSYAGSAGT
jgi:hypothetical protein